MTVLLFVVPALVAAAVSYALTPVARRVAIRIGAIDQPGPRKIHSIPTPRLGGLAVLASLTVVLGILAMGLEGTKSLDPILLLAIATGGIPIIAISVLDDIRSQRAIVKFGAHLIGASIAVAVGIRLSPDVHVLGYTVHIGLLAIPISILWLAGITSAFNIVDGLDGLSAGLALISAISLAAVSIVSHKFALASTAAVLAGALIGFLPHNLFPAKIYLGDTGACSIGFFLGCLTLAGGATMSAGLAVVLPMLVVGVPLVDTLLSMVRRLVRRFEGESSGVFDADRNHIHHRLLALGLDHRRAVLTLYGIGVIVALFGFASLFLDQRNAGVLLITLLVAAVVGISKLNYDEFAVVRSGTFLRFYTAPVLKKGLFAVFVDLAMVVAALYGAIVLKYDDWGVTFSRPMATSLITLIPAITLVVFASMKIYQRSWANANIDDVLRLSLAILVSSAAGFVIARISIPAPISTTFFLTYTLVLLVLVGGSRASYRVLYFWNRKSNAEGDPVVIYGAGLGGSMALREILMNRGVPMKPIGFIDDDASKHGRFVNGYPVLGGVESLAAIVMNGKAAGVVVSSEKIPIANVRRAKQLCDDHGIWLRSFSIDFRNITGDYRISVEEDGPARPLASADR